jgi:hypothetical protein
MRWLCLLGWGVMALVLAGLGVLAVGLGKLADAADEEEADWWHAP